MGDPHEVVVDHVGEVVGRHAVALEQDLIVKNFVFDGNFAVDKVGVGGAAFPVDLLPDHMGSALGQISGDDGGIEAAAAAVVTGTGGLVAVTLLLLVFFAEAVVGGTVADKLLGIFPVDVAPFALDVGPAGTADIRPLVVGEAGGLERIVNDLDGAVDIAVLVGILDAQDEFSPLRTGQQIGVKGGPEVSDVHVTGRTRRKPGSHAILIITHGWVPS